MEDRLAPYAISARIFIDYCKDKFGWSDLSKDVIMDIGCGENGYCGKSILEKFPDVRYVIGIDKQPNAILKFRMKTPKTRMECDVADISNRQSLKRFEGKMSKVISTFTLHQVEEKEEAFRNTYHLLKPGGEAAFLVVLKSLAYDWLTEIHRNLKWKGFRQRSHEEDLYKSGAVQYKEMAERAGFQIIECSEKETVLIKYSSDQVCKQSLYLICGNAFNVPSEMIETFKEECFQTWVNLGGRNEEGMPCFKSTDLSLLLVKPALASGSATNQNQDS